MKKINSIIILGIAVTVVAAFSTSVYAIEGQDDNTVVSPTPTSSPAQKPSETAAEARDKAEAKIAEKKAALEQKRAEIEKRRQEAEAKVEAKKQEIRERFEGKKLELCQKREGKVQNIMARAAQRGEKQIAVFTKIADRTEAFYKDKGLSIDNYATLVVAVENAKSAAEAQVAATKAIGVDFNCDSENPLGTSDAFKESVEAQKTAMKAFKTAVKNLIVAVKTAAEASAEATSSEGGSN